MVSIGFRVSPTKVTYALVQGIPTKGFTLLDASAVFIPPALETPRQLQFIRTTLLDVMEEYAVSRAGLRLAEGVAQRRNPFRLNLEGVIQELLASSSVERFVAGPIATMASLLGHGSDRGVIKKLISGEQSPVYAMDWATLEEDQREAVLMAVAAASASVAASAPVGPAAQMAGGAA
jgi:hypothetical protein